MDTSGEVIKQHFCLTCNIMIRFDSEDFGKLTRTN